MGGWHPVWTMGSNIRREAMSTGGAQMVAHMPIHLMVWTDMERSECFGKDHSSRRFLKAGEREEDPWRLRDIGSIQEHLCYASWIWRQVGFRERVGGSPLYSRELTSCV